MGKIFWLASYPKSGNTWTRLVLANYRSDLQSPVEINDLGGAIASRHQLFDTFGGVDVSELTPEEVDRLRPRLYLGLAEYQPQDIFVKIHDAFRRTPDGAGLVPSEATRGVVYLVRNPLDVAVSYARYGAMPVQETVDRLCRPTAVIGKGFMRNGQVPQVLFSWSRHVTSWVDESGLDVHVARYEDLLRDPHGSFAALLRFARLDVDAQRLSRAIEHTRFERLQAEEQAKGFKERPLRSAAFFREGKSGTWRKALSSAQAARIIDANREVMLRFGYLTESGEPVF